MAVVRANMPKIPIVLAWGTPSVESEVNARRKRYTRLALPERFGGQHLPSIEENEWDVPLWGVVTEAKVRRFARKA